MEKGNIYFDVEAVRRGIKGKAVRGGGAMLVSRSVGLGIHLISTVILARLLTPQDFGLVAMVTAFSLLFYNVGLNGFREAIIQKENIEHKQVSTIFWIGLALSTSLALIFSIGSPILARFYKEPRLIPISIALSVGFIFSALATEHIALIIRNMQFHKLMINEIAAGILSTALAIWMALNGYGYWAIVARQLSMPIISSIGAWLQCSWRPGLPAKDADVWPIIKFAYKTFAIFMVNYFGRNLDKVLLGRRWGSQELGNYDRAYHMFVMPVNQLVTPLSGVALATLSRLHNEPQRYRQYFLKALTLLTLIGMYISVVLTINGQDIISLLLGPQWKKTGIVFSALSPAIGMTVIYGTIGWLHLSQGTPGRWLKWGVFALISTASMFMAGLPFGSLGIAIAYSLSFYLLTWPGIWYAGKPMGIRVGIVWGATWRFYAAAALSGLITWVAINKFGNVSRFLLDLPILLRIASASVVCTALYFLLLAALLRGIKPLCEIFKELIPLLPGTKDNKTR